MRSTQTLTDELQQLADRLQDAYAEAVRTQHRPRVPGRCFDNTKEQVSDLLRWWRWGDSNSGRRLEGSLVAHQVAG
jgi:hypothetical protein